MSNPYIILTLIALGGLFGFSMIAYGIFCMIRDSDRCWWK